LARLAGIFLRLMSARAAIVIIPCAAGHSDASVRRITQGLFPGEQREMANAGIVLITDETER
jgi:hypothetical protein